MRRIGSSENLRVDERLKERLVNDWRTADLCEFDVQMLEYAEKVTRKAHNINQDYIDSLKASGFTDHMLHDIVQVSCYFAYVNRLADGLGVELEHSAK